MEIKILKTGLAEVKALRALFLHESNFQFIYNKCHQYGWADTWLFQQDGISIGYGSVWGKDKREERDAIFEFYLLPLYRKHANIIFPAFHVACGATYIECQSNDILLTSMLYTYCRDINAEAILFKDQLTTNFVIPGVIFRKQTPADKTDDGGEYVLDMKGEIVATGGYVGKYNLPYIDMFYEVKEPFRRKGFGSFMTQELKREAYAMGRVPAARCNIQNHASKATLLKAGLEVCGFRLTGSCKEKE